MTNCTWNICFFLLFDKDLASHIIQVTWNTDNKFSAKKNANLSVSVLLSYSNLAVTYSHMGNPHTTIGVTTFHFWVRHGFRWVYCTLAARIILFIPCFFAFTCIFAFRSVLSFVLFLSLQCHTSCQPLNSHLVFFSLSFFSLPRLSASAQKPFSVV